MTLTSYLLQVSLALAGFAGLYALLLRRETYYRWNRLYFSGTGILAFLLPYAGRWYPVESEVPVTYVPDLSFRLESIPVQQAVATDWRWPEMVQYVWLAGMVWMSVRLLHQLVQLVQIRLKANAISVRGRQLLVAPGHTEPFSFFNWIFVHPGRYTAKELEEVIRHEEIHARQRHSLDVLLVEGMQIVLWCNPVVWWWSRVVRQNLEFLTDREVLASGMEAKHYQYHLLRQSGIALPLANQFNVSELKNRIRQINTPASSRWKGIKLLGVIPMLVFLTMAFTPRQVAEQVERSLDWQQPVQQPVERVTPGSIVRTRTKKKIQTKSGKATHASVNGNRRHIPENRPLLTDEEMAQLHRDAEKTLYILDGKEVPYSEVRAVNPWKIQTATVLKDPKSLEEYGEKGKYGVVLMTLKKD